MHEFNYLGRIPEPWRHAKDKPKQAKTSPGQARDKPIDARKTATGMPKKTPKNAK